MRAVKNLLLRDGPDLPSDDSGSQGRRGRYRWLRIQLERLLLVIGALCLGYYLYVYWEARLYQAFEDKELDTILENGRHAPPTVGARPAPAQGSTIGRIEIPRLGVSAIVRAGS